MPTYKVLTPLQHDGKRYEHGELVVLDEITTDILINKKVIEFVPDEPKVVAAKQLTKPPDMSPSISGKVEAKELTPKEPIKDKPDSKDKPEV